MSHAMLGGCGTALVTPFRADGAVDEPALRALVRWQLDEGVDFLVPCGSTGEAATMSRSEHLRVVEITVEEAGGRVPVVAGAGGNDTARALELSRDVAAAGATHLLHVSPMYNRPPQRGLIAHFLTIADAVDVPLIVYNVPGRTGGNVEAATTLALAEHPRIVGVKEASANFAQIGEILRSRPEGFAVLSGDDALTLPLMALGADGVISVVSNAVPRAMAALCRAAAADDVREARRLHEALVPFMTVAFVESNPIPIKAALAALGRCADAVRSPLVPLSEVHRGAVRAALAHAGVELP